MRPAHNAFHQKYFPQFSAASRRTSWPRPCASPPPTLTPRTRFPEIEFSGSTRSLNSPTGLLKRSRWPRRCREKIRYRRPRVLTHLLAGCNGMLVMSGVAYTSRLRCILELFVYTSMRDVGEQQVPGIAEEVEEHVQLSLRQAGCSCSRRQKGGRSSRPL